jgi:hypothetical protein
MLKSLPQVTSMSITKVRLSNSEMGNQTVFNSRVCGIRQACDSTVAAGYRIGNNVSLLERVTFS